MTSEAAAVVEIAGVVRNYQALRPLRIASLAIAPGERVALSGLDLAASEVLVNLITGAALPDEGEVRVFGRLTSAITSGDEWLASLDRFGIVSPRAVLMESASIQQNLAMPYTLQIDPVPADIAARVERLAVECGMSAAPSTALREMMGTPAGQAPPEIRARLHFARAIALDPALVLLEHPTAALEARARQPLAADVARVLDRRGMAALVLTQDEAFARRAAHRTLKLQPATGEIVPLRRGWFG